MDVEFDEDVYLTTRDLLEQQFGAWVKTLESFVSALGLAVISNIGVTLTRYGMGGSYSPPNNVIINIARASGQGLIQCVLHETLHLHIEHLIQHYGLKQWEKEGLVELLFDHAFPELYQAQRSTSITEDTRKVFERLFPERSEMLVRG